MNKKIFITGATGLIGTSLVNYLCEKGAYVKILCGNIKQAKKSFDKNYTLEYFDKSKYHDSGFVAGLINETDVVINLAGANVGAKRWNTDYKELIYNSRIETTKLIVESIKICKTKPECLINMSGAGIYGFRDDEKLDEESTYGNDFLAKVCIDWESEARKVTFYGVREVSVRSGIVLTKKGGALEKLMLPYNYFMGAYQGSGRQWMPWIHIEDLIRLFVFMIENKSVSGPVNAASPEPVTNLEFAKTLAEIKKSKIMLPVPGLLLKIIAGEFAENLLTGQRVYPVKAITSGYEFMYPDLKSALLNLIT